MSPGCFGSVKGSRSGRWWGSRLVSGARVAGVFRGGARRRVTRARGRLVAAGVVLTIVATAGGVGGVFSPAATAVPVLPIQRIFGPDAIGTAIAASRYVFFGGASAVVLARSDFFADALAGGPLAAKVNAPLLITPGTSLSASLDPRVLAEIQRVLPTGKTVYILGGPQALSSNIDSTLQGLGYNVTRVQGANEFATAVAIANQLGNPSTVFEATGLFFADALSAVPAAVHAHGAILLTNGTTQAPETAAYLATSATVRYVIGGPLAAYQDPLATRFYGPDEYGTSAEVAKFFFAQATIYGAATGLNYPDALAGGVFIARGTGPMLLVNTHTPLPTPISAYLHSFQALIGPAVQGYVFGGPIAVGDDVLAALEANT